MVRSRVTTSYPAAVFFDAYGTLIHFPQDPSPFDYMADALRRAGVALPRPRVDAALRAEMRYYKAHFASVRTADDFEQLRAADARVYLQALGDTGSVLLDVNHIADELTAAFRSRVLPDARPAIDLVRAAGVRAGVLSNYSYLLPLVLDEVGLGDCLDPVVFSAAVGAEKPDARIFAAAAAAVSADLDDCVLIGDDLIERRRRRARLRDARRLDCARWIGCSSWRGRGAKPGGRRPPGSGTRLA